MPRNRDDLKANFKKNSVPTEAGFADLIDSGLNQAEDGITKLPDDPLTIEACGKQEALLRFKHPNARGGAPTWTVTQAPDGSPEGGLAFQDATNAPRLFLHSTTGNVGIGTVAPGEFKLNVGGTASCTGLTVRGNVAINGAVSGPLRDYFAAQFCLSGGGTVTWLKSRLKWTKRFIAISMGGTSFSEHHVSLPPLNSGTTVIEDISGNTRPVSADGFLELKEWEALYAVHTLGGQNMAISYRIAGYPNRFLPSNNWILVAVVNGDDKSLKLGTGAMLTDRTSISSGCPLPVGTIVMWSGTPQTVPAGWALCDGGDGRPNLSGRFVLGMGGNYSLNATGGAEVHQLSPDEMPSHSHSVIDPGHSHRWTGTRQRAGTDDDNNTSEFSKGDYGTQDTVIKDTDPRVTGISLTANGGSKAHNNMPPYWALAYIIKL